MIATLIIIGIALAWLGYETDWLRIRLESTEYQRTVKAQAEVKVKDMPQAIKLLTASKPVLALSAGDPASYPMTLTTTVEKLRDMINQLAKTELELTEEVLGYDYSDQT